MYHRRWDPISLDLAVGAPTPARALWPAMLAASAFLLLLLPSTSGVALNSLSRAAFGGVAGAWTSCSSAVHHALEPRHSTATLDELANVRIKGRESEILAHVALPSEPQTGPLPVLVLVHEFFGLSESIVAKAQLFADDLGCLVIAPDTFRGVSTSFIPRAIWLALSTPQDRVNRDLDDVLAWADSSECARVAGVLADTKRVAVCGFCYGGGKALRYTTQARPSAATVVWYGSPLTSASELKALRAPVCGVFGTEDLQIPQPVVNQFRAALEEADIEHEVMSYYGAGHAFWSDVGQVEREEMPVIAGYRLTTNFLKGFYAGKESFAKKRAFLEFQLAEQDIGLGADESAEEDTAGDA